MAPRRSIACYPVSRRRTKLALRPILVAGLLFALAGGAYDFDGAGCGGFCRRARITRMSESPPTYLHNASLVEGNCSLPVIQASGVGFGSRPHMSLEGADTNLHWYNRSWWLTAYSGVERAYTGGAVATSDADVYARVRSDHFTPPASGWSFRCANGSRTECPWTDDSLECEYCPWNVRAMCKCSPVSGQDAFGTLAISFWAAGRGTKSLAAGYLVKEDYLRSSFIDLETAPHTNSLGLYVGIKFTLGATTKIRAGEKIVVVIPHLKPMLSSPIQDLTKYTFVEDFQYSLDGYGFTMAEQLYYGDNTGKPVHKRYKCASNCHETASFSFSYTVRDRQSDSTMGDNKHYALIMTAKMDIAPSTLIHLGVRVDPQYACDEETLAAVTDTPTHTVSRKSRTREPTRISATGDKRECVRWSTTLRANDKLWTITSNTASVHVFPPIPFTASAPFGVTCERAAMLQSYASGEAQCETYVCDPFTASDGKVLGLATGDPAIQNAIAGLCGASANFRLKDGSAVEAAPAGQVGAAVVAGDNGFNNNHVKDTAVEFGPKTKYADQALVPAVHLTGERFFWRSGFACPSGEMISVTTTGQVEMRRCAALEGAACTAGGPCVHGQGLECIGGTCQLAPQFSRDEIMKIECIGAERDALRLVDFDAAGEVVAGPNPSLAMPDYPWATSSDARGTAPCGCRDSVSGTHCVVCGNQTCPQLTVSGSTFRQPNDGGEVLDANGLYTLAGGDACFWNGYGHWVKPFGLISLHLFRFDASAVPSSTETKRYWFLTRSVQNMSNPIDYTFWSSTLGTALTFMETAFTTGSADSFNFGILAMSTGTDSFPIPPSGVDSAGGGGGGGGGPGKWASKVMEDASTESTVLKFEELTTLGQITAASDGSPRQLKDKLTITCACLNLIEPRKGSKFKIGEYVKILWESPCYCELARVIVTIYRGNTKVATVTALGTPSGSVNWPVPSETEAGTDYRVHLAGEFRQGQSLPVADQQRTNYRWRPRPIAATPHLPAATAPELFGTPFEVRMAPRRAVSTGDNRDVIVTLGLESITLPAFRALQSAFEAVLINSVKHLDENVKLEVMEVVSCPCLKTRTASSTQEDSFDAPVASWAASGRRLSASTAGSVSLATASLTVKTNEFIFSVDPGIGLENYKHGDMVTVHISSTTGVTLFAGKYTVASATASKVTVWEQILDFTSSGSTHTINNLNYNVGNAQFTRGGAPPSQTTGIQLDLRLQTKDYVDGSWANREKLRSCNLQYERMVSGQSNSDKVGGEYKDCMLTKAIALDLESQVQSGALAKKLEAQDPKFANTSCHVVVPPFIDDLPSSVLVPDMESLLCSEMMQDTVSSPAAYDDKQELTLSLSGDALGVPNTESICEAMLMPQLDEEGRELMLRLATGAPSALNVSRVCMKLVEASANVPQWVGFTVPERRLCAQPAILRKLAGHVNATILQAGQEMNKYIEGAPGYGNTTTWPALRFEGEGICCALDSHCVDLSHGAKFTSPAVGRMPGSTMAHRAVNGFVAGYSLVPATGVALYGWSFTQPLVPYFSTFQGAWLEFQFKKDTQVERYSLETMPCTGSSCFPKTWSLQVMDKVMASWRAIDHRSEVAIADVTNSYCVATPGKYRRHRLLVSAVQAIHPTDNVFGLKIRRLVMEGLEFADYS